VCPLCLCISACLPLSLFLPPLSPLSPLVLFKVVVDWIRYRNTIKALNWFSSVRRKLDDPLYSSWFVKFKVCVCARARVVCLSVGARVCVSVCRCLPQFPFSQSLFSSHKTETFAWQRASRTLHIQAGPSRAPKTPLTMCPLVTGTTMGLPRAAPASTT
jgi:hypothetical protein